MTKSELLDKLLSDIKSLYNPDILLKKFPEIFNDFNNWIFPDNFLLSQKIYHYLYDDIELKIGYCICGKRCYFKSFKKGYCKYCSKKCRRSDINPMASEESRKKVSETKKKQYLDEEWHNNVVEKSKKKCEELYGGVGFASKELKEKSMNTNLKRNGSKEYRNQEKAKQTNRKNIGVDFPFQSKDIQEKVNNTFIKKIGKIRNSEAFKDYAKSIGVENISQTHYWAVKSHKKIVYDDIKFDSKWEVIVYKFCKENGLNFEYQPNVTIEYIFNNKKHYYHPDFLIEGKLFEVKGEQFFENDKLICPYNRNKDKDDLYEAKQKCMVENGVIIIRKNTIDNIENLLSLL